MIIVNKLLEILPIIFYPFANILILILLGFGLTYLIIPKYFRPFIIWLSPWTTIIVSIVFLIIMSLLGLSVKQAIIPLIIIFLIADIYVLKKIKLVLNIDIKENLLIAIIISFTLILNLLPLIRQDKMLTSVSMGNNDIIAYTNTGDYLKDHSIAESKKIIAETAVDNLLHGAYRWGTPIINSFFLVLLNLQAYQYTYISQTVLFSLFIPLVYILFRVLFARSSLAGLIMTGIFTGLNANLLYMLYHDFFGQVLFWGIEMLLLIFFYYYFSSQQIKHKKFNRYDFILGVIITVLYYSYHEAAVFVFAPLIIYLLITFFYKKNLFKYYLIALLKIGFISIINVSLIIYKVIILDYGFAFIPAPNQPIGWQLFRSKIPFANPFEAMGFWSIHNFEPMPIVLAIILSVSAILVIIKGILKSQNRILTISYLLIFTLFLYWMAFIQNNFYTYNRVLTYTLPFIIIIFSIGINSLFKKGKYFWSIIIVILIGLELWSGVHLNKKFRKEHLSIGKSYISILDLKDKKIKEPIYVERFVMSEIPLWMQMWADHFLYFKGVSTVPIIFDDSEFKNKVPDNSLILISKPTPWFKPPQVLLKNIVWENEYYKLGRLCNSNECLMGRSEDLSFLTIGKSDYEDSLLINGWSVKEETSRWAVGKESTLRLVTKKENNTSLFIEALTLKEPQELSVYIDDQLIGKQSIKTNFQDYRFRFQKTLSNGVHNIIFKYSNVYQPVELGMSQDTRELGVNFRKIKLE